MLKCLVSKQGTTGNPKGAALSHHGILNNAYFIGEVLNYDQVNTALIMIESLVIFICIMYVRAIYLFAAYV